MWQYAKKHMAGVNNNIVVSRLSSLPVAKVGHLRNYPYEVSQVCQNFRIIG